MVSSQLCHTGNRRLLFLLGVLAVNYLLFQSILVPYGNGDGNAPWSSVPQKDDNVRFPSLHSAPKYFTVWNPPTGNVSDNSTAVSIPRRKMRCMMPPKSRTLFQEMNRILVRKRASARATVLILISLSIMS